MPFYLYDQNNSGGFFTSPQLVVVYAENAEEANELAERHGVYFDGCETGTDCSCCGDRWNSQDRPTDIKPVVRPNAEMALTVLMMIVSR